jgi:hypothetical protein
MLRQERKVKLECQECGSDQQGAGSSVGEGVCVCVVACSDHIEVTTIKDDA